jgi:sugar phosphate isomerase/epimerase
MYTRREFGKLALASVPAVALFDETVAAAGWLQGKPNSLINGVQVGVITYSYRSLRDQSAEATLKYVVESGVSAIELMGGPVNAYARARTGFTPSGGAGRGGGGGGGRGGGGGGGRGRGEVDPATLTASWNGVPCAPGREAGARGRAAGTPTTPAAGTAPALPTGGGRGTPSPEQQFAAEEERKWRLGLSMDIFKDLRKLYNDAGVSIYAVKDVRQNSDEDLEYTFAVAEALGATHVTLELPTGPNAAQTLKRLGDWGLRKKIYAAYHTHEQGSMSAFDEAFAISKGNTANVDFGHYVGGGNIGGSPLQFLEKFHGRISSFHLKDRTTPKNCALNLPWGTGETPIKEILQMVQKHQWKIPATIELEYAVPEGSDAVKETRNCVEYCRKALA